MKKRIIALALALVLVLAFIPAFGTLAQASETPSSWAAEIVARAIAEGFVPQSLQSNYTQAATRAEFAAILMRFTQGAVPEE